MIGIAAKDSEQKAVEGAQRLSHKLRHAFWTQTLEALRERGVGLFENVSPSKDHWLCCGTGVSACTYTLIFLKNDCA